MVAKKVPAKKAPTKKAVAPKPAPPKPSNNSKPTQKQLDALKKNPKPFVATSVVGSKGSKPNMNQGKPVAAGGGKNIPKIRQVPQMSSSAFRGSGTPLGSSFAKPTRSQLLNAGLTATGAAAATGFKVGVKTVVSEGTKKLQRELSKEMKDRSMKGLSKEQRNVVGESRSEMDPTAAAEYLGAPKELRKQISNSMKKTNKKTIVVKKKK